MTVRPHTIVLRVPEGIVFLGTTQSEFVTGKHCFFTRQNDFVTRKDHFVTRKDGFVTRQNDIVTRKNDFMTRKNDFVARKIDFVTRKNDFVTRQMPLTRTEWITVEDREICVAHSANCGISPSKHHGTVEDGDIPLCRRLQRLNNFGRSIPTSRDVGYIHATVFDGFPGA